MADVKWIKITTDVFDDEKILLIESLPEADSIIVIWFKLLCLAGKQNNSGVFMMGNSIPYTDKMLATIFRRKESTVQMALEVFEKFGMIELIDGVITIPNWGKHQNLEQLEARREYQREYHREYRQKQKMLVEHEDVNERKCLRKDLRNDDVNTPDKIRVDKSRLDKNREEEIRVEENIITVSKETVRQTDVRLIVDEWNTLAKYGISSVVKLSSGSKRYQSLVARIEEYSVGDVLTAIDNIRQSKFLQGKVKGKKQWVITFDWFVLPNNFPKVLENQYADKEFVEDSDDVRQSFYDKWKDV